MDLFASTKKKKKDYAHAEINAFNLFRQIYSAHSFFFFLLICFLCFSVVVKSTAVAAHQECAAHKVTKHIVAHKNVHNVTFGIITQLNRC